MNGLAFTVMLTPSPQVLADECGTRPFCGNSWPTQGCYPIPIICGGIPDPGPIIPAPLPPPTTTPPGPSPHPSPRPPPYTIINPYPISDSDAAAWGLSMTPGTDPGTLQPTRRYATAPGRTLPMATRQALAHGIENYLSRLGPGWFCSHFSDVSTDATQSVVDCMQVDDTPAPAPHVIRIAGFPHGNGGYPAPEARERYSVASIYDALRTGREMDDPVYQSMGPVAIFAPIFFVGGIVAAPQIMAMSPNGITLMGALADAGLAAAGADGATAGSVSAAVAGEWITLRGLREPQAGRVMAHLDRLGARLFPDAGNLNSLARELAYAGDGPMAALVERGDPNLSRYLTHYARERSAQYIRFTSSMSNLGGAVEFFFKQATNGMRGDLYLSLTRQALGAHSGSVLSKLSVEFFNTYKKAPIYYRALPTKIVTIVDPLTNRNVRALKITLEVAGEVNGVLQRLQGTFEYITNVPIN